MAVLTAAALKFTVRRQPAVLVPPAAATPRELKQLSDVDDQKGLRFHAPIIHFYRRDISSMDGRDPDPAAVIRDAVAKALVYYYPLAGRLRELDGSSKLAVDCTGEGVLFIEADADVRLEQFGDVLHPPFPYLEQLLFDDDPAGGPFAILNSPLVLIQVTRLACGGFVLATRMCHAMADAKGMMQFLEAVSELARGAAAAPTVRPVWARDLLMARDPPRPSFAHREFDDDDNDVPVPVEEMVQGSVFFTAQDVTTIKAQLPAQLRKHATTFDAVTGFVWKCRTMALQVPDAAAEMRLGCAVSAVGKNNNRGRGLRLPRGYYGNTIVLPVAIATAGELCARPVGYAVELVRKAKAEAMDAGEYIQSVADLMVLRERKLYATTRLYVVSDVTKIGLAGGLDFGWGKPVYGGAAPVGPSPLPGMSSFLVACKNAHGEDGIVVPMCLPAPAMDRFTEAVGKLMMRTPATVSSSL